MSDHTQHQIFHATQHFLRSEHGKKTVAVLAAAAVAAAPVLLPLAAVTGLGYAAWRFFKS